MPLSARKASTCLAVAGSSFMLMRMGRLRMRPALQRAASGKPCCAHNRPNWRGAPMDDKPDTRPGHHIHLIQCLWVDYPEDSLPRGIRCAHWIPYAILPDSRKARILCPAHSDRPFDFTPEELAMIDRMVQGEPV